MFSFWDRVSVEEGKGERETQKLKQAPGSELLWQHRAWCGALTHHEITTWAEVGHSTNWATQAPLVSCLFIGFRLFLWESTKRVSNIRFPGNPNPSRSKIKKQSIIDHLLWISFLAVILDKGTTKEKGISKSFVKGHKLEGRWADGNDDPVSSNPDIKIKRLKAD